jgi:hypothetical protein
MKMLQQEDIRWIHDVARGVDPAGRVFVCDGDYYRAIFPGAVPFVTSLFDKGIVDRLVEKGLLIDTVMTDHQVDGFGLVLKHRRVPFLTRGNEWNRSFFLDAARMVIDLNLELLKDNLCTIDYHWQNVQQKSNCSPVWIDFGSICPLTERHSHVHQEFFQYFVHPLYVFARSANLGNVARALTGNYHLNALEFHDLFGGTMEFNFPCGDRRTGLEVMKAWLDNLSFPSLQSEWSEYFTEDTLRQMSSGAPSLLAPAGHVGRAAIVSKILNVKRPAKIIDLGCNAGLFSLMGASTGADVYSCDADEGALEYFYRILKECRRPVSVTLAVRDICDPPHKSSPVAGDMVLALAITHHLFFTRRYTVAGMARILSSYSTHMLITEFMPDGLGRPGNPVPNPLPEDYTLDNFRNAFSDYFRRIETIEYDSGMSRRIFIVCVDRRRTAEASQPGGPPAQ